MADENRFEHVQQWAQSWEQFVKDTAGRVETALAELGTVQARSVAQLVTGLDEAGRYAKEGLAFAERAGGEWRKVAIEATRRTAQILTPKLS